MKNTFQFLVLSAICYLIACNSARERPYQSDSARPSQQDTEYTTPADSSQKPDTTTSVISPPVDSNNYSTVRTFRSSRPKHFSFSRSQNRT